MSVRKNERTESRMEFIINAKRLRKEVTDWLFRDFGSKTKKTTNQVIRKITDEDKEILSNMFEKYNITSKYTFSCDYPDWFINFERETIIKIMRDMMCNITHANSIYPVNLAELNRRRLYQDIAIGDCFDLKNEIQNIADNLSLDINKLSSIIERTDNEIRLLKGWRQSDNKKRTELEKDSTKEK